MSEEPTGPSDAGQQPPLGLAQPDKLLRIGMMVREMLSEVRRAPVDTEGRKLLRDIHERSVRELREVLPAELADELGEMSITFGADVPTESELRVAQAQLTGWLEGLFHGIQAAYAAQQLQAQSRLGELHRRVLEPGDTSPDKRGYL